MKTNQDFLKKGISLLPTVSKTKVNVAKTVNVSKEKENIVINEVDDFNKINLTKGNKVCLDFGNHYVGYLTLSFNYEGSHPDAPVLLKLKFAEHPSELFEDIESYNGWVCSSWVQQEQTHIDIVPSVVELSRRYAFRYVQIEVVDISSKFSLVIDDAYISSVSSADNSTLKSFNAKDDELKKLDEIAVKTLHDCMQVVFEDGPKRDRRLWLGDLRLQALANYQTYQKNDMVKACLYLFAGLPAESEQIGACLFIEPTYEVDDTIMFDYSLLFVSILLDYYNETKDIETLKDLFPTAIKQINIAKKNVGDDGIVKDSDVIGWCFLDWNLTLNKQAGAQGVLLYVLDCAIKMAEILEDENIKVSLENDYKKYLSAAKKYLWDNEKGLFVSGADKQISWASQIWLILGGAVTNDEGLQMLNRLDGCDEAVKMVTPYMYHNYVDALIKIGETDRALKVLKEYWGGMANLGADTFWELYNPENPYESPYGGTIVNSYCHAWSCAPAYFLRKYFSE